VLYIIYVKVNKNVLHIAVYL